MALSLTYIGSIKPGPGLIEDVFQFTASGSGDTLSVTVSGLPISSMFYTPQGSSGGTNLIASSPPTFGAFAAGTVPGTYTATLTANSGGVVTNGILRLMHAAQ